MKKVDVEKAKRIRLRIKANTDRLRLSVARSNKYVYAQIIDDANGKTLVSASGRQAYDVGKDVARKAKEKRIKKVVFDRGRYKYHGRVMKVAEGAREGGLSF